MRSALTVAILLTLASLSALAGAIPVQSLRQLLLSMPTSSNLGGDTSRPASAQNAFSFQAANAPRKNQRPFSFGNRLFNTNWVEAPASVKSFDGLGPLFNRVSCSGCHTKDGRGQPPADGKGPFDQMLLRISIPGKNPLGGPNPVPSYGDQINERSIGGVPAEGMAQIAVEPVLGQYGDGEKFVLHKPAYAISNTAYGDLPSDILISPRVAPHMIGLGLLEAVPADILLALSDPQDSDGDGISGRMNIVWDAAKFRKSIGRFGWKAGQPDLLNQNAAAAIGDIGLTNPIKKSENCEAFQHACNSAFKADKTDISSEFLEKLTLYTATLSVPAQRGASEESVQEGARQFRASGCAACHFPTLQTKSATLPELVNQTFHPYTDLLLHDMGEGLADNRPEFEATGREWRTPPLWGLGLVQTVNGHSKLLHDGRAQGFTEAILWHGGEAETAKEAFRTLSKEKREALINFLKSL